MERALETEMSEHLGHGKSEAVTNTTGNTRNGHSAKTLQGEFGELPLNIPRDRQGAFEPKLVERHHPGSFWKGRSFRYFSNGLIASLTDCIEPNSWWRRRAMIQRSTTCTADSTLALSCGR
ncbi:hypothetical protein OKW41_005544 [Paraburkholderia sp. UCT70]